MVTRIGTDRSETLRGTAGRDTLDGRGGNDQLLGLEGDDRLFGGAGANRIDGGPGRDFVSFLFDEEDGAFGSGQVTNVDLLAGTYTVGGVVTRLTGIEDAAGGSADDTILGDNGRNSLGGDEGDDLLRGRGGDDDLFGSDGRDRLFGDGGNDTLTGGSGSNEGEELHGGSGDDLLELGFGGDQAWGDAGVDQFRTPNVTGPDDPLFTIRDFSTRGGDVIELPEFNLNETTRRYAFVGERPLADNGVPEVGFERRGGETIVRYEPSAGDPDLYLVNEIRLSGDVRLTADDFLLGFATSDGADTANGTRFADFVRAGDGDDRVSLLAGDDLVFAGGGADRLAGGEGDDGLYGDVGNDTYNGGAGDDLLIEDTNFIEPSDDTYVFSGRFGSDRLADSAGDDRAVFSGLARSGVDLTRDGDDLVVTVRGRGDSVTVEDFYARNGDLDLVFRDGTLSPEAIA